MSQRLEKVLKIRDTVIRNFRINSSLHGRYDIHDIHGSHGIHGSYGIHGIHDIHGPSGIHGYHSWP
jgi:hypothetical protein